MNSLTNFGTSTFVTSFCHATMRSRVEDLREFRALGARTHRHDLLLVFQRGVIDLDVEHEAVELRFRQRIGSFLLDGVLRGDDEERLG